MVLVDTRPGGLDVYFRPGDPLTVTLNWPAGTLAGRTFTATLGAASLGVSVVGNVMTITATPAQTAVAASVGAWELVDTTAADDVTVIVGRWAALDGAASGPTQATVTISESTGEALIGVTAPGPATSLEALPAATLPLDGAELVPGLQDDVAVKITTAELAGGPVETLAGVTRNRVRHFDHFEGFTTAVATDATLIGDTKMRTALAGTGAQVSQGQAAGEYGIADLSTGTATTGRCAIVPNYALLFLFTNTQRYRVGARVKMPAVSDGTNTYQVTIGMGDMTSAAPADAILFRSPTAAGNWSALIRDDSADLDVTDTGVAVDSGGAFHTFVVEFDPTFSGARWYIDGLLVASETVNEPDALANLANWGVGIFKSAGATARIAEVDALSWDIPGVPVHNMP